MDKNGPWFVRVKTRRIPCDGVGILFSPRFRTLCSDLHQVFLNEIGPRITQDEHLAEFRSTDFTMLLNHLESFWTPGQHRKPLTIQAALVGLVEIQRAVLISKNQNAQDLMDKICYELDAGEAARTVAIPTQERSR